MFSDAVPLDVRLYGLAWPRLVLWAGLNARRTSDADSSQTMVRLKRLYADV